MGAYRRSASQSTHCSPECFSSHRATAPAARQCPQTLRDTRCKTCTATHSVGAVMPHPRGAPTHVRRLRRHAAPRCYTGQTHDCGCIKSKESVPRKGFPTMIHTQTSQHPHVGGTSSELLGLCSLRTPKPGDTPTCVSTVRWVAPATTGSGYWWEESGVQLLFQWTTGNTQGNAVGRAHSTDSQRHRPRDIHRTRNFT